jgi:translation elongation factor EF-Tu-like GTPase
MEVQIGHVTHYYTHLGVASVVVDSDEIKVGDLIHIKGHTTDLTQPVESIEYEHEHIDHADTGKNVGIKVREHVREHDAVMKVVTAG